jgi:hypothetical protein
MNLVHEVCRILSQNYITYGIVRLDSLNRSPHHILSDNERVFVKLLRPETNPAPLQTEIDFAVNTTYGTNPLFDNVHHRSSRGLPLVLSAWEWERLYPIGTNMNPMQAAHAARELFYIHNSLKYPELNESSNDDYLRYGEKLGSPSFKYLTAENQNRLRDLFKVIIQPVTNMISSTPEINVVSHGRATPENLVMKEDYSVVWTSFEESRAAPREYDLAHLYLHLVHRMHRPELWTVARQEYETLLGRSVSDYGLNQFAALLLGRRALTIASKTLHATDEGELNSFLKELEPLVKGVSVDAVKNFTHLH